jgi:hypothetical protein
VRADAISAARVEDPAVEGREGLEDGSFEVLECELAEGRPEA